MKRKELNIAFLDIDNVITEDFEMKDGNFEYGRQVPFKPKAKECLYILQYYSRCKYVITSSWRINLTLDELKLAFSERGLRIDILDITPPLGVERGQEIDLWLETNNWDNYIVIDDQIDDIVNWCENIIKVDPNKGFTEKEMDVGLIFFGV